MKAKVIVDTSVWIEYFRRPDSNEKKDVDLLLRDNLAFLGGIILAELLQGTRNEKDFELLRSSLSALPFCEASFDTWANAGYVSYSLRRKGITIPLSDSLIAALALENNCQVYTLDPHFGRIENIKLYEPNQAD